MRTVVAALALVLVAGAAEAQTRIQNPQLIAFTPSPDHANISSYKVEIVSDATKTVIQTIDIGKPAPCVSGCPAGVAVGEASAALNVQPVAFGSYTIVMRAVGGGITGPASGATEIWERAPGPPSKGRVQ